MKIFQITNSLICYQPPTLSTFLPFGRRRIKPRVFFFMRVSGSACLQANRPLVPRQPLSEITDILQTRKLDQRGYEAYLRLHSWDDESHDLS